MRTSRTVLIAVGAILALSGCASTQAQGEARPSVTGSVDLPPDSEIISGAVVHVKLMDQTESKEIGYQSIERPNSFPVEFDVKYNASDLMSDHGYAIEASVEVRGATKYRSARPVAVLTGGAPTRVQIQVEATN